MALTNKQVEEVVETLKGKISVLECSLSLKEYEIKALEALESLDYIETKNLKSLRKEVKALRPRVDNLKSVLDDYR